jgi:hypothetical protein
MLQLAARMEELSASGKLAKLKPETANLCARALRAYAARPDYEDLARAICGSKNCTFRKFTYSIPPQPSLRVPFASAARGPGDS